MNNLTDSGRSKVLAALRAELLGPLQTFEGDPIGKPLNLAQTLGFDDPKDAYGPFHEAGSGNEVLTRDRPTKRYGVGVLYPREQVLRDINEDADESESPAPENEGLSAHGVVGQETTVLGAELADDDFDLTATSEYRPSAMALSFLARLDGEDELQVQLSGGRYESITVRVGKSNRNWFVRRPIKTIARFVAPSAAGRQLPAQALNVSPLAISVDLLARRHGSNWLCTVAIVNEAAPDRSAETSSLFQADFSVQIIRNGTPVEGILPYPDVRSQQLLDRDPEARSLDLLYRKAPTFGVGHGCAATWDEPWGTLLASAIRGTALPVFEAPSVTPDVFANGVRIEVPVGPLAGVDPGSDGFDTVVEMAHAYGAWISDREREAKESLSGSRLKASEEHLTQCKRVHARMLDGLQWLRNDPTARRAFILANRAILEQHRHFRRETRKSMLTSAGIEVEAGSPIPTWQAAGLNWRAFQIGFLVASARSAVDGGHEDRKTVELIFFPTGGGKTEAYLGLAAFCLFYERLTGRTSGVSVLMRYTLRLLTSQQFLRASALVCAMEVIRKSNDDIGGGPFSVGIWVGRSTTPNTRADSIAAVRSLAKGKGENPFLVLRCPWCAAQMGPIDAAKGVPANVPRLTGYRESAGRVEFRCPDKQCHFRAGLPVLVVDEDIYSEPPSIVIGTVDKFAMLAFTPKARALFGLGPSGDRQYAPPSLIIQDELHLIAGPLGSMVGIYEAIIEDLCTDRSGPDPIRPKIIGSTATIRNYSEQIRGLYGRKDAALFPPHGLDAADSFFAQHATDRGSGKLLQGRMYVGVHAPGLGSIQTAQVRTGSALLQAAVDLPPEDRDPWWTSLMFFNSLRELGSSVSLLQSDIPDYLYTSKLRRGITEQRYVNRKMELTSRLRQDEIPQAIGDLERTSDSGTAVDVCLASNIIEVGVDIPRLSLLTVLGQPKSTSQYIQITGRVGRSWQTRPGLVVTIYSPLRSRDRSHFEKFQSYHQRLYAEVEPVSVTPFSFPVLRRAAHAAAIVYVRQTEPLGIEPWPFPAESFDRAESLLAQRADVADSEAVADVKRWMNRLRSNWLGWEPAIWEGRAKTEDGPLLRRAGEWVPDDVRETSWSTPMSMRDVDAECRCEVTNRYAVARGEEDEEEK